MMENLRSIVQQHMQEGVNQIWNLKLQKMFFSKFENVKLFKNQQYRNVRLFNTLRNHSSR